MRRPPFSIFFPALISLLLTCSAVRAAGLPLRDGNSTASSQNGASRFPFLTWLRDSAIEFIFGSPPSGAATAAMKYGAHQRYRYDRQSVLRFNITSAAEEAVFAEAVDRLFLDVWSVNNVDHTVDIRIHEEDVSSLLSLLPHSLHRNIATLVPDVAAAVWATYPQSMPLTISGLEASVVRTQLDDQEGKADLTGGDVDNVFFQEYQPLPVIIQWMKLLDVMFPIARLISVGQSAEGRDILGLRLSTYHQRSKAREKAGEKAGEEKEEREPKRKTILITGGLHGREWISTSSVNYVAWTMISNYGKGWMTTRLLDHFDFVFVPVVNPDGYDYTWSTDRLWRKTRQGTNFRYCRGLDLDHAFGYEWDSSRPQPCSETYGGEQAFQAVEARSLSAWAANEMLQNGVEFVGYLDLHSYSQQIMFPFSYSCAKDPPNLENLEELAYVMRRAIIWAHGERYNIASACEGVMGFNRTASAGPRIESGGGSAIDWFYHELKAKFTYQIKLRDTGSYGFLLPSSHIIPTGQEMVNVVMYFSDFILGDKYGSKSLEEKVADNLAESERYKDLRDDMAELRRQ